ncbi:hypothetical protein [Campylobacter subantarcticus]|uniref:Alpha-2,3-sialyltransferase n=1 Tax=Campylobacter subantarcticus LMG 24374 TaxID=1388751 RepID=A0A0A8H8A4_9BACT|nr:hypothetical protein [Campylobacter subantarcticus]AJC90207.1 hypothetical protein CSUB8521_0318 [Campylobacter subantarcticus LMG 24374]
MDKKIAVHLFGHLRTYKQTYKSFFEHVIKPNQQDGWDMDVFLHTWDEFDSGKSWSKHWYMDLSGVKMSKFDIEEMVGIYHPKKYCVERYPEDSNVYGMYITLEKVNHLKLDYEKETKIKYNYHLYTRPDIMFFKPFRIDTFLKVYSASRNCHNGWEGVFRNFPLPKKTNFCSSNAFRFELLDSRMPNEGDLIWFNNFGTEPLHPHEAFLHDPSVFNIFVKYRWEFEFRPWRSNMKKIDPFVEVRQSQLDDLMNQINTFKNKKYFDELVLYDVNLKKKQLKIANLEQDLINKKLQTRIIEKRLKNKEITVKIFDGGDVLKASAKARIQNQLSYKLGQAMIVNSKSFLGYIRMPFVLSYIKDKHKQEQKIYQEKIKKDPSLALPPLESYPDYKEALKEKECLTYKLGEALIKANKTWYGGGVYQVVI